MTRAQRLALLEAENAKLRAQLAECDQAEPQTPSGRSVLADRAPEWDRFTERSPFAGVRWGDVEITGDW